MKDVRKLSTRVYEQSQFVLKKQICYARLFLIIIISSIVGFPSHLITGQTIIDTIQLTPATGNGLGPVAIDINTETNRIYIANLFSNNFSVLDSSSHEVIDSVTIKLIGHLSAKCSPKDLRVNSATNKIYVLAFCSDADLVFGQILNVVDGSIKTVKLTEFSNKKKIGINPNTNRIYLTGSDITVLDGATDEIIGNIDASGSIIGINTLTNLIYIVSESSTSVIDGETDEIIDVINVGGVAISIDEESNRLYIGSSDSVNVIDGLSGEIVSSINVGVNAIVSNPITNRIYIVSNDGTTVVDSANNEVLDEIDVNGDAIAVNRDENQIYIISNGTIVVIDGVTNEIINNVSLGASPVNVEFNSETNMIYTSNEFSNTINVIDGSKGQPTNVIHVKGEGTGLNVNPTSNLIYAISDEGIRIIDGLTNEVIDKINVSGDAIKVNPITNIVYAADEINKNISVIDGMSNTITSVIDIGGLPAVIAINQLTNRIYVAEHNSEMLYVIDGENNDIIDLISIGEISNNIAGICVNSVTNCIYVTSNDDSIIGGESAREDESNPEKITLAHVVDGDSNEVIDVVNVFASEIPQTLGGIFGSTVSQHGIIVNETSNRIYITNMIVDLHDGIGADPGALTLIDGFSNSVKSIIDIESTPYGIAIDVENNLLYTADRDTGQITVILDDLEVISTLLATPETLRSSINHQVVTIATLDQLGEPLSNVEINATVSGKRTSVSPSTSTTGVNGTADFLVRFGFVGRDASVTFTAEGKSVIVTRK